MKYGYALGTIYPFIITLICLIFFFIPGCQICLVFPLLLMFNLFDTLLAIIQVLFREIPITRLFMKIMSIKTVLHL